MILTYNRNENATVDQKVQSLMESVQLALNSIDAGTLTGTLSGSNVKIIKVNGNSLIGTIDGNYVFMKNLDADNIVTGNISADRMAAEVIEAINASIDTIDADHIDVDSLKANFLDAIYLTAERADIDYAKINGANIDSATLRNAWIDKLMVQSGLLANTGTVYELDAIQVNASKIKAGTIDVERLIVTVDGEKYMVHFDSQGSASYQKLDGGIIEDNTISADKILAGSITTRELTAQNLVGTNGWINLAAGVFAYVNATTGEGIVWDGTRLTINASQIMMGDVSIASAIASAEAAAAAVETMQGRMDSGEFKGEKGDKGDQGVSVTNVTSTNNTSDGGTSVITVTLSDGTSKTFNVKNGNKGTAGASSQWYYGTACTHTSGTAKSATGIASAIVGDMYLNTNTYSVYRCTTAGASGTAVWTYAGNLVNGVIDGIEVGGRNLLRAEPRQYSESAYNFISIPLVEPLEADVTYTLQIWDLVLDENTSGTGVYWGGGLNRLFPSSGWATVDESGYFKCSFTPTKAKTEHAQAANLWLNLFNAASGHSGSKATIGSWKLEKGNIATDWTPAPEDVDADIQSAQQIADEALNAVEDIDFNDLPLYWSEEIYTTTTENDYPILIDGEQIENSNGQPLYWDASKYSLVDGELITPYCSFLETDYPVTSGVDEDGDPAPVLSHNLAYEATARDIRVDELEDSTNERTSALSERLDTVEDQAQDNTDSISAMTDQLDAVTDYYTLVSGKVNFEDGILVGDQDGSNIKITGDEILLRQKGTAMASLDTEKLNIETAKITYLRLGSFILENMADGTLVLKER